MLLATLVSSVTQDKLCNLPPGPNLDNSSCLLYDLLARRRGCWLRGRLIRRVDFANISKSNVVILLVNSLRKAREKIRGDTGHEGP